MKTHRHHIIPKHAGGSDDPSNLVTLTIADHALAHKALFEQYGRWQDRVAWLSLAGIMKDEERIYEILRNSNPGGYKHSDEIKKLLSEMRMGEKNPMFGKPSHNRGVSRSGVGGRKKGSKWSESERANQEKIRSADGYYDFTKDEKRNKLISDAKKGKPGAATGKSWFNDGKTETYASACPPGFIKGRIKKPQINKRGLVWYNNGVVNKQFKENNQEEGFARGRLIKK
jgi:NUMOD3 motif/HNH endonuclease